MAEKYSISGRIDTFEYEIVSATNPVTSKSEGLLKGVTGGSITWDDETDLKVTGTLTVADTNLLHNKYVRIYYVSKIPQPSTNGQTKFVKHRYLLATCYADTEKGHLENGKYSGTVDLEGTLARYIDDETTKNISLAKNTSIISHIKKLFSWYGGTYKIEGVKDRKTSATHVWEFGSAPFTLIGESAAFIGGVVDCDRQGRTIIRKYVAPSKRSRTYTYPTGENSVTLVGVDIASTQGKAYNRVAIKYMKSEEYTEGGKKKTRQVPIYGLASVANNNIASKAHTGRFRTYTETVNTLKQETTKYANDVAKDRLTNEGGYIVEYTVKSMFLPISIGQIVRFQYEKIDIDGYVKSIEYELKPGCPMTVVLEQIRKNK